MKNIAAIEAKNTALLKQNEYLKSKSVQLKRILSISGAAMIILTLLIGADVYRYKTSPQSSTSSSTSLLYR